MEFKVGDRVRVVKVKEGTARLGDTGIVIDNCNWINDRDNDHYGIEKMLYDLIKIGEPISKYSDLKERIEALDNGWTKEADDIIQELTNFSCITSYINIWQNQGCLSGGIELKLSKMGSKCGNLFTFETQCEKHKVFQKALLWWLDHSDIKKQDHSQEIAKLKEDMQNIQKRIEELEKN